MRFPAILVCLFAPAFALAADSLPARYFRLMEAGTARVEAKLKAAPDADLKTLEAESSWRHFPYAILAPAVLYSKQHRDNPRYRDKHMRDLAIRIGDMLAGESEKGTFEPRLDSDWDTYMWLDAYRLLERELGDERRERWKREIRKNIAMQVEGTRERLDFAWYNSPYIGTSPNHYALWAANLYLGGRLFGDKEWEDLGRTVLRRFAMVEQTPDGYWGEHSRSGPTIGYNHLTLSAVAMYWEFSKDKDVLPALRRATDFHKNCTFLDGTPIDVFNDRNRYWGVSAWAQFAFSNFPDGRGYAAFLTSFFDPEKLTVDQLGRLAQDALYYHEGPSEAAPQQRPSYSYRMSVPAGVRKTGPWQVALSGLIDTQTINNRFYLDRQGHLSIFHQKAGLIITGANSKRQPELATFSEELMGQVVHMPLSSRLQMSDTQDRLSLAYNTFFSDLYVMPPSDSGLDFRFVINGRGTPAKDPKLTLQLVLEPGEELETGSGRKVTVGQDKIEFGGSELGGSIRHHGWTLSVDRTAQLRWPVYPHNPYSDIPETNLRRAVAVVVVPLNLKPRPGKYVRPRDQEIEFKLSVP
ncbi:MAG TPA: hypothetical protein VFQ79_21305 [Bryobacteraceae bacterium]|nr:hypothetical protein [Bryobacteraceae bacterium]